MNVTPAEFKEIWEVWNDPLRNDAEAAAFMRMYYGCRPGYLYRVVVDYKAPCIPMYSGGLERFEYPDAKGQEAPPAT